VWGVGCVGVCVCGGGGVRVAERVGLRHVFVMCTWFKLQVPCKQTHIFINSCFWNVLLIAAFIMFLLLRSERLQTGWRLPRCAAR